MVDIKTTSWDLTPLFSSDIDPTMDNEREKIQTANNSFISKWKDREDYLQDPAVLKEALDEYELLTRTYGTQGKEGYYFWLRSQIEESNPDVKAKVNKIEEFGIKIANELQFFTMRIAKIDIALQPKFLEYTALAPYKHFLEKLFTQSQHLLSEPEEKILTLKSSVAYDNWVKMTSSFLSKEEGLVLQEDGTEKKENLSQIISLLNHSKKEIRDSAAKTFNEILDKYKEVAEMEVNSILANKKIDDDLRGFSRPDESRHMSDDVESAVIDSLIVSVSKRYDISQRYYALKAKLMGVKALAYHERNVDYGKVEKQYSFQETVDLVHKVVGALDKEFADILELFVQHGHIDVYPQKGKRSGAFCAYNLHSQPTFMMLNFAEKLLDVTTLAHELGHGINDELMRDKQNALNFGTPTSTAEVASTFMEDFVLEEIIKSADEELQLAIMVSKLNTDISTIFRQIACYQFEQDLHDSYRKKGYLSYKKIGEIFQKHMSAYMGSAVEQSEGSENWWIYWNHIRTFFYVYSYASGLLISKSMQANVKKDPVFIQKVKTFLSAGESESPKNIFKNLGIDITDNTFWDTGLLEIETLLTQTEALAEKYHTLLAK
ncbi:MAG TPA: M3 family oligoendopeptidase [Candidatus Saccharimonadales bacterium]|nr:M3 family oligoendopeptidase [Candidatus Saccharimonadales bacterium]